MSTSHKTFAIICGMVIVALLGLAIKVAFIQHDVNALKKALISDETAQY